MLALLALLPAAGPDALDRAGQHLAAGRYDDAARAYAAVAAQAERRGDRLAYGRALGGHGNALLNLGDPASAIEELTRAAALVEEELGPTSVVVADVLGSLGVARYMAGDPAGAVPALERAVAITEGAGGGPPETDAYGETATWLKAWTNLGLARLALGDVDLAVGAFDGVLSFETARHGPDAPEVARAAANLGYAYAVVQRWDLATPLFERSLAALERSLGHDHPDTIQALYNVATTVHAAGDLPRARVIYVDVLDRRVRCYGEADPSRGAILATLGHLALTAGEPGAAAGFYTEALAAVSAHGSQGQSIEAAAFQGSVWAYDLLGDTVAARAVATRWLAESVGDVARGVAVVDERQRMMLVGQSRSALDTWLGVHDGPADANAGWDAVLRWKGEGARALSSAQEARLLGEDPAQRALFAELAEVRGELATVALAEGEGERLDGLRGRRSALERKLARKSPAWTPPGGEGPREVCAALPDGAALVDLYRTHPFRPADAGHHHGYVAFVTHADTCDNVIRVDLPDGDTLEAAGRRWRSLLATPGSLSRRIDAAGDRVRTLVWDPLVDALRGAEHVYLAPDASLASLPLAALPVGDGRYLLESVTLSYLEQAPDLVRVRRPSTATGALVVGGVSYEEGIESSVVASRRASCVPGDFAPLPATRDEAREVATALGARGERVTLLDGRDATEARLRVDAPAHRIVHLATHGFFAAAGCEGGDSHDWSRALNPMVLSGVVLAGANHPPDIGDDGIWTAEEVSALDLHGTELVVLSACETGLGETRAGEGVMGLRRAFSLAGVSSLVLSLWTIDDTSARVLLGSFYRHFPDSNPGAALRSAQLEALAEARRTYGEGRPELWGAFMNAGR